MNFKKVLVVYGGWNREREVSLMSTPAIIETLKDKGYEVQGLDFTRDFYKHIQTIHEFQPDVVFNNIYGRWGEDGCIQGLWEMMGIHYTHSGVRASANAMHKPTTQYLLKTHCIPVPEHYVLTSLDQPFPLAYPYVMKPTNDGSSVAVKIIKNDAQKAEYLQSCTETELMVDAFIPGRELSVAILEDGRGGVMEIVPKGEFYDYHAKYVCKETQYIAPAQIPDEVTKNALKIAKDSFDILGCKGVARVDMRYNPEQGVQGLYVLEVNTLPGLTPRSIVPQIMNSQGMNFGGLLSWLIENAQCLA